MLLNMTSREHFGLCPHPHLQTSASRAVPRPKTSGVGARPEDCLFLVLSCGRCYLVYFRFLVAKAPAVEVVLSPFTLNQPLKHEGDNCQLPWEC